MDWFSRNHTLNFHCTFDLRERGLKTFGTGQCQSSILWEFSFILQKLKSCIPLRFWAFCCQGESVRVLLSEGMFGQERDQGFSMMNSG